MELKKYLLDLRLLLPLFNENPRFEFTFAIIIVLYGATSS